MARVMACKFALSYLLVISLSCFYICARWGTVELIWRSAADLFAYVRHVVMLLGLALFSKVYSSPFLLPIVIVILVQAPLSRLESSAPLKIIRGRN